MSAGLLRRMSAVADGRVPPNELESVVAHLSLLLNARQGGCSMDAAYGMPDFTEAVHNFPSGIVTLQRMISESIQRYEPRLKNVSIRPLNLSTEQLTLSFEIRAQLQSGTPLRLETTLSRGGRISIT